MSGPSGVLTPVGRLVEASNATFLVTDETDQAFVYKPVRGEAPLRDFPHHTLSRREVAAYRLSAASGFDVVPPTYWVTHGPAGPGSVQRWVEDVAEPLATLALADQVPEGWFATIVGADEQDRDVVLCHANSPALRRLALFDVLVNNTDRKAGHILHTAEHLVLGCDHGVTFHVVDKLRTVLWGWAGEPLTDPELALVESVRDRVDAVRDWLDADEVAALARRAEALLTAPVFPKPAEGWRALPWPPV